MTAKPSLHTGRMIAVYRSSEFIHAEIGKMCRRTAPVLPRYCCKNVLAHSNKLYSTLEGSSVILEGSTVILALLL